MKSKFFYLINNLVKFFMELFIFDRKIRRVLKGNFCKFYLKDYIKLIEEKEIKPLNRNNTYRIWQYWESGIENAPDIVKTCVASVDKYKGNLEHIILTGDSIKDYIKIPDYIYKLKAKGAIKSAHFADIVRTYLLYEYGGCWIDATVLLMAPLPQYIRDSELFVFKSDKEEDPDGLCMANYFISSGGKSIIIAKMKAFLDEYWKRNDFAINYFFYLHAFTMLTDSSKENFDEWNEIFNVSFIPVERMQYELLDKFNEKRLNELKKASSIHKLTYKWHVITKSKKIDTSGTLYEMLIKNVADF